MAGGRGQRRSPRASRAPGRGSTAPGRDAGGGGRSRGGPRASAAGLHTRNPANGRNASIPAGGRDARIRAGGLHARIREVVRRIPPGRVAAYGQIAAWAGHPGAARQVARALRAGHGLPWHRVVAAGGRIALPGEAGWEQRLRLQREGVRFRGRRVHMAAHQWRPGRRAAPRAPAGTVMRPSPARRRG